MKITIEISIYLLWFDKDDYFYHFIVFNSKKDIARKVHIFNITSFCNLKNIASLGFQTFKVEMAYAVANANIFAYFWYGYQGSSSDTKCDLIF